MSAMVPASLALELERENQALREECEQARAIIESLVKSLGVMRGYACDESMRTWPTDSQFESDCAEADALIERYA